MNSLRGNRKTTPFTTAHVLPPMRSRCPLHSCLKTICFRLFRAVFFLVVATVNPSHALSAGASGAVQTSFKGLPPPCEASLELMAGQMIMVGFRGISAEANPIIKVMNKTFLGGVILFDSDYSPRVFIRNISSREQLSRLTAALHAHSPYPLLVAVDQEGGRVRRLKWEKGFTPLPPAAELGAGSPDATRLTAGRAAAEMQMLGINLNFAPLADVNINPVSPAIGALQRSFSAEPQAVASHAGAFLQGMKAHGVAGCLKHFPGHGSATGDTHLGSVDISETWAPDAELLPYKTLIKEGLAEIIMVGHLMHQDIDSSRPTSLSPKAVNGILREQLGYEGVVITDDLQMNAITSHYSQKETILLAIKAGADILLCNNNVNYDDYLAVKMHKIILDLVAEGKIERKRLEESYRRIRNLKQGLSN